MKHRWKAGKRIYFRHRHHMRYCRGGPVFAGLVSTFGPPGEGAGTTATGVSSSEPGIAIYNSATLGATFRVTIGGHTATLTQTDLGPAPFTGRVVDVTGAGSRVLGINPGAFPTDSWGEARLLPAGCA
jgi:hypothetical protein